MYTTFSELYRIGCNGGVVGDPIEKQVARELFLVMVDGIEELISYWRVHTHGVVFDFVEAVARETRSMGGYKPCRAYLSVRAAVRIAESRSTLGRHHLHRYAIRIYKAMRFQEASRIYATIKGKAVGLG